MASTLLTREETDKVKLVCETVVDYAIQDNERGRTVLRECQFCFQSDWKDDGIDHTPGCAYVAAKSLLTEALV